MKKNLLNFFLVFCLTLIGGVVLAQPTISYAPANPYPTGTAMTLNPTLGGTAVPALSYSSTGTVILNAATNGLNNPYGLGVDPAGNVYVTNFTGNTITEYSTTGVVTTFGSSANLSGPVGIVFDNLGNAYVLNQTSSNVVKYTGGIYQSTIISSGLSTPTGIAIDGLNNIYIGSSGNRTITKYTTAGGSPTLTFLTNGAAYPVSAGISVDPSGNIYVVDNSGGAYIDKYTSTGTYTSATTVAGTNNFGIYVDGSGDIYTTNTAGTKKANVYGPALGTALATETGFTLPKGIVTDQKGNLYVSDYTANTVTKYAPTGGYFISSPPPPGLAFTNTSGKISGTPTANYTNSYTVTACSGSGNTTSNVFPLTTGTVTKPSLSYSAATYNYNVGAGAVAIPISNSGGAVTSTYTFTVTSGALFTGLTFNSSFGYFVATNTTAGTVTGTVTASNTTGSSTTTSVTINCLAPVTVTPSSLNTNANPAQPNGGLTGNPIAATGPKLAVYGLQLNPSVTGSTTNLTAINFNTVTATSTTNANYIANAYLVSSSSNTYTTTGNTTVSTITAPTGNTLNFTLTTPLAVSSGGGPLYYYVLVDYTTPVTSTGSFQVNFASTTGVTSTGTPPVGYNYDFPALTVAAASIGTPGSDNFAPATISLPQAKQAIYGVSLTASGTGPSKSITGLTFTATNSNSKTDVYYYTTAYLYVNTTPSFTGSTQVTSQPTAGNGSTITFTLPTAATLSATSPLYYYVAIDYVSPGVAATNTQKLVLSTVTGTTFTGTPTGASLTYNPIPVITAANLSGAALTSGPKIYYGQTNIAVAGISLKTNASTATLSQLTFSISPVAATAAGYFQSPQLVTSGATFNPLSFTVVSSGSSLSVSGNVVTCTIPSATISTTATYYYLLVNYTVNGTVGQSFNFAPTSYTANVNPTPTTPVTVSYATNTYTCTAPSFVENINNGGLEPNPIAGSQNNTAIFGFSLQDNNYVAATVSSISFTTASGQIISNYFPNVALYSSTNATFPGIGSSTLVASQTSPTASTVTFGGLTESISAGSTLYYYLVVSYTETATNPPAFQINLNTNIASPSTVTYNTTTGTNYTFTGTSVDWLGVDSVNPNDWNTADNWSTGALPGPLDNVNIGVGTAFTYIPTLSTGTATVASIIFGGNFSSTSGVTVNGTSTLLKVTGDISVQGDINCAGYVNDFDFTGTGALQATNLNVLANYSGYYSGTNATSTPYYKYTLAVTSGIANFSLFGNVALTSLDDKGTTGVYNASFSVTGGITSVPGLLKTSNSGTAANEVSTLSVTGGTLQLSNAAALTNTLSTAATNTVSFNNTGATIEYSGAAQTVYTDLGIQGLTTGPSYYSLKFSGTGVKTPNGTTANNLNITGNFTNSMANDGVNYPSLTSTVINFNGTAQTLIGGAGPTIAAGALTTTAPSPTGTVFNLVNFSGAGTKLLSTGGFVVASTGVLAITGTSATIVNANGLLTLNSSSTSSANVAPITTTGQSISGNVNVQRYLKGGSGYRGYRLMSSPVNGSTDAYSHKIYSLNYLVGAMYLKGSAVNATPNTGGFDAVGNDNIYLYRENEAPSSLTFFSGNYNGINSLGVAPNYSYTVDGITPTSPYNIPVGDGFLAFFRGDRNATDINSESSLSYVPVAAIATAVGTLNQGTINTADWYNDTATGANPLGFTSATANSNVRGFNLLGNPYASTIDLNTASTTAGSGIQITSSVETNFYELNTNSPYAQQYAIYDKANTALNTNNAQRYIASGEGFIVKVDATGQTVIFNEAAKVPAASAGTTQPTGATLFMASRPEMSTITDAATFNSNNGNALKYLRLTMKMDSTSAEDAVMAFNETASANYVQNVDALYKQGTGKVSMSSISADNQQLAINILPFNKKSTTTIPLYVSAVADGTYSLNLTEIKNIPAIYEVWLMDAYAKDSLQIRQNPTYSFNIAHADTNTFGSKRFTLVIRENALLAYHLLKFDATKAINGSKVTWDIENEQNYTGFTVQRTNDNGKNFDDLGVVPSNSGGNYSYLDTNPLLGTDGYRLQITDLLGNISYSKIVPLLYSKLGDNITKNTLTIYPNPTIGAINVAVSQQINSTSFDIQIVNSGGMMMKKATSPTANWQSDVSKLLPGTYVIQIVNNKDKSIVGKGTFVKL